MGHPAARDGFSRDLSCALALVAAPRLVRAALPARALPPPFPALQTDADVGRGEAHQRRRFLVGPERARFSLLDATAADGARLVGGQITRVVQAFLDRLCPRGGNSGRVSRLAAAPAAAAR